MKIWKNQRINYRNETPCAYVSHSLVKVEVRLAKSKMNRVFIN